MSLLNGAWKGRWGNKSIWPQHIGIHDKSVSGNHQAPSHWSEKTVETKTLTSYLPCQGQGAFKSKLSENYLKQKAQSYLTSEATL